MIYDLSQQLSNNVHQWPMLDEQTRYLAVIPIQGTGGARAVDSDGEEMA